ncbi:NUDIX domain-containing protein [Paenibacillus segetis]|uniref:ADP-ribose pyrophosphatase n=1 Tax=Paenibacillus segetis TaxID=1325360 RepID=A0ABQ1YHS7_9BACL|nr:NUDIX hydrolase [Paenibacillus segetis]GGH24970.1 ADP-ribose pyrophosphatase [Paenibacillus segetis]
MTTAQDKLIEKTISTEPIFSGRIISLQIDTVELPDGSQATREVVKHPGAVAVIAIHEGRLLLVDQYRQPMGRCELEIPAGKLEKGEDPMEAAKRELQEETGYRCEHISLLHSFYTSPGFADEMIHLYLAEGLSAGEMALDEDEFLEVYEATLEECENYIAEGRIADSKTIMAVYIWKQQLAQDSQVK